MKQSNIQRCAKKWLCGRGEFPEREPDWLYHHGLRVSKLALYLADKLKISANRQTLAIGALFHDIGKGKVKHAEAGANMCEQFLKYHCNAEELSEIIHLVRNHNNRKQVDLPIATRILQDADALDHVGYNNIWRAIYWSGTHAESQQEHWEYIQSHEYKSILEERRDGLNFDISRKIFDKRLSQEQSLFQKLHNSYHNAFPKKILESIFD